MEKQNRSAIISWIVPAIVLLAVVFIMLFNFSAKSSAEAADTVSRNLIKSAQDYGDDFLNKLETMDKVAGPFRVLIEQETALGDKYVSEVTDILYSCTDAYQVIYSDSDGYGVDQTGEAVFVGDEGYFQNIVQFDSTSYVYIEGTGSATSEKSAVVVAERIMEEDGTSYLLLFYPMDKFDNLMSKSDFDYSTFLTVVDSSGKILGTAGAKKSNVLAGDNLLDIIQAENPDETKTIQMRLDNGSRGSTSVKVGDERCMLVYVPLGVNRWAIVLGVGQAYVDRQVDYQWQNARKMLVYLIIAISVFIFMVIIINIVSKIRSNEKKKELEDKADTDLLTGLTNKLATERKIKEYMSRNPNSQSMLFVLDIDNFKKINDTMGHAFGDEVLRSLGQQITAIFRASDIIGRVGGDEFMIFLKNVSDQDSVRKEAKKVENFFHNFQAGEYVKYAATASIGVAIFPQEGNDFESLYKAADQGLYKAKKRGKNQLAFYRDEWVQPKEEQA